MEVAVLERTATRQSRAIARMQAAPRFFNQEEWDALASYAGTRLSLATPEGCVPDNLEADDND